jgi:hypothetical protein
MVNIIDVIIMILRDRKVIEIGGPTPFFEEKLPLYKICNFDGFNIKDNNYWQNVTDIFNYSNKKGIQYFGDASNELDLIRIVEKYDCLVTSHVLEHNANPIKNLMMWKNILKEESYIITIIPDKRFFWDSTREITTIEHLIEDFNKNTDEYDQTHIQENLDTSHYKSNQDVSEKAIKNHIYRVCHHHVFDINLVIEMHELCGFETINCFNYQYDPLNILYFGRIKNK